MASKAAPPAAADPDLQYIMTCIKHLPTKFAPDFDEVAKESGKKGRIAALVSLSLARELRLTNIPQPTPFEQDLAKMGH